ncbi:MAG: response regulator, partial [Deltaproteobacteria bacterium]|nr:response regulator [Deltaproteobacteria bacterium]
ERILFIDDEPGLVEIGRVMLGKLGYDVVVRTSSIEALELFRTKPDEFDLVITDMTMPNMTGDKLAKELMQIRPDIPIILCTGFSKRITEEKAKEIGIKAFVMKPLVMRDLANTVRKALMPALARRDLTIPLLMLLFHVWASMTGFRQAMSGPGIGDCWSNAES